jgi:hypothetical protein
MSDDLEQRLAAAAPRPTRGLDFARVQAKTRSLRRGRRAAGASLLGVAGLCTVAIAQLLGGSSPVEVGSDPARPSPTAAASGPTPAPTATRPVLDCPEAADEIARGWTSSGSAGGMEVPELVSAQSASAAEAVAWRSRTIPTDGSLPPATLEPPQFLVDAPAEAMTWVCIYWSEEGFTAPALSEGPPYRYLIVAALEDGQAQMLEAHPNPPSGESLGPHAEPEARLGDWHTPAPSATCYLTGDTVSIEAGPAGNEWQLSVAPDDPVTIQATLDVPATLHVDRLQWEIAPEGPGRAYQGGPLEDPGPPVVWWTIATTDLSPGQHTLDIAWDATDRDGNPVPSGLYHLTGVAQARPTGPDGTPCEDAQTATIGAGLGYFVVP